MYRSRSFPLAAALLATLLSTSAAHALVICAKEDLANPGHPKEKSKLYLKAACDPVKHEVSIGIETIGVVGTDATVKIAGANLQVVSGGGSTYGTPNGLGNVIVGYNAEIGVEQRGGSHNVVVGDGHTYGGTGGVVFGLDNWINSRSAVLGGHGNQTYTDAVILNGEYNTAQGAFSTASGYDNYAFGDYSNISGGQSNQALGVYSSVTGGYTNGAGGDWSSVTGGDQSVASANYSTVTGGHYNVVTGQNGSICGGRFNTVSASYASVSGGYGNDATGTDSVVSGGSNNTAAGGGSTVSGGANRSVSFSDDWRAGSLFEDF